MKQLGFTLIEMMIVLAVLAILLGVATPNFAAQMEAYQTRAVANELYTDIYWAKEEAIKRRADVTVDMASNGWRIVLPDGTPIKSYTAPYQGVGISGASAVTFDGTRGLTEAENITVAARSGQVKLNIVALGYADICSNNIGGFRKC